MSKGSSLSDWARCPRCGDGGKVVYGLSGLSGGITFECESRSHRLNRRFFSPYKKKDRQKMDKPEYTSRSLFAKVLNPYPLRNRLAENVTDCFECPYCSSSSISGGIENLRVEYDITRSLQGLCVTLWCDECGAYDRNTLMHNEPFPDEDQIERFVAESEHPPDYIER